MKLICVLMIAACVQVSAGSFAQTVSASFTNSPIEKVFKEITRQTGYSFIYQRNQLEQTTPVTLSVKNEQLEQLLRKCFEKQPLTFTIVDKYIVVQTKPAVVTVPASPTKEVITVSGKVMNEAGEALAGATVTAKKSGIATSTNDKGEFVLKDIDANERLLITSIGYHAEEIEISNRNYLLIKLKVAIGTLDETIIMAYGKTSKRLNTGNISKVSSEELSKQPVSNPLLALAGRIPGLSVTQSSGLNGAAVKVQLRGQNSILQGSEPLYIIDGIPFAAANNRLNQITNATDEIGMSPFNLVNIDNIESIEVLKDADATAIYGSRGANGVILISTKKGTAGKAKFRANINSGFSKVTRTMDMLNTQQYIQMRREGLFNDGLIPSANPSDPGYAPDIMIWDTTRYTDLKKLLIGEAAYTANAQVSLSGGSINTQFLIGAAYQKQTTVFPTTHGDSKTSVNFSLNHTGNDKKLSLRLSGNYLSNVNSLNIIDLTSFINLPPNIRLYDNAGKISWQEKDVFLSDVLFRPNPLAALNTTYNGRFKNLISNFEFGYEITKGLKTRINLGYNMLQANETSAEPSTAIDPYSGNLPSANFANRTQISWIAEPQLEYTRSSNYGTITTMLGTTWQENKSESISVQAFNYTNDLLLGSVNGAGTVRTTNSGTQYRYTAFFGRLTYNFKDRYIINVSGRRDGSTRFGPENRFSNFGAIGGAWIFSNTKLIEKQFKFLSFGKLRTSYGITGNDQIGDYKYLDTWTAASNTYQGIPVTNPTALFNPNFSWERNKKIEAAVELGFLSNKILLSAVYYRNRSNNQLISYTLPVQTGFTSVLKNLDALLQNQGMEFQLNTKNITSKDFTWTSALNITVNRNKLIAFPGLSTSSYANTYTIGKSVSTRRLYSYLGVDPSAGLYQFDDVDANGLLDKNDRVNYVNTDPKFFGGLLNALQYKGLAVSLFFEFRKQKGYNFLSNNSTVYTPGYGLINQPVAVLSRWQKPGDISNIQQFTATSSTDAFKRMNFYLPISDANISDASFIRCKNISFSYDLPAKFSNAIKSEKCLVFLHVQNLFVITKYEGADPETQNMFVLPPLRTIVAGFNLTLK